MTARQNTCKKDESTSHPSKDVLCSIRNVKDCKNVENDGTTVTMQMSEPIYPKSKQTDHLFVLPSKHLFVNTGVQSYWPTEILPAVM